MTKQDKRAEEVKRLRAKSHSWRSVAKKMGISVSTAIRLEKLVTREPAASEAMPIEPKPEPKPVVVAPVPVEAKLKPAVVVPTPAQPDRLTAQKLILAHRIRGEFVPRELRIFEDARRTGGVMLREVVRKMRADKATLADVEKYVEAELRA